MDLTKTPRLNTYSVLIWLRVDVFGMLNSQTRYAQANPPYVEVLFSDEKEEPHLHKDKLTKLQRQLAYMMAENIPLHIPTQRL